MKTYLSATKTGSVFEKIKYVYTGLYQGRHNGPIFVKTQYVTNESKAVKTASS